MTDLLTRFHTLFFTSYIQTFDDRKSGDVSLLTCKPFSSVTIDELHALNKRGAGIFFTPNPCHNGRKEENVTAVEWIYADLDEGTKAEMKARILQAPIQPHLIVESSRSFHLYWKCRCAKAEFKQITEGVIEFFGADPAISSVNEVLRLPGFLHMKAEPFPVKIRRFADDLTDISPVDMISAFPTYDPAMGIHDDDLYLVKDVPVKSVLDWLGIQYRRNVILENGKETSARIHEAGNYVTRFSGKPGSGSTIDVAMGYGNMDFKQAIDWLRGKAGIEPQKKSIVKKAISKPRGGVLDSFRYPTPLNLRTWSVGTLDEAWGRPQPQEYAFILGKPGSGKTAFCLQMAIENAKKGVKTMYLSLEMKSSGLMERYIETVAGISDQDRETKGYDDYSENQKKLMRRCQDELEHPNLTILDEEDLQGNTHVDMILELAKNYSMIFVDNFGFVQCDGKNEVDSQRVASRRIVSFLNQMPRTIIMLHHFAKGQNGSGEAQGRGSQKLIDDATKWIMLERNMEEVGTDVLMKCQKDRHRGMTQQRNLKYVNGRYEDARSAMMRAADITFDSW